MASPPGERRLAMSGNGAATTGARGPVTGPRGPAARRQVAYSVIALLDPLARASYNDDEAPRVPSLAAPPMITGYNTDVRYRERVFHVQTEDKGLQNPSIETVVY